MILLVFTLFLASCQRETLEQDEEGIVKTKLKNGLTVLIKEDHSSPLVTILTRVLVGYLNEPDSKTGISHLLEHMYFKGTEKRPSSQDIWKEARSYGARLSGQTSYDETTYAMTLPSRYFEQGLELQSDALLNPKFDPTELSKETEVVIQEGKRKKDNPTALIEEALKTVAFKTHRLKRWRMGTEEQLRSLTRHDMVEFHKNYYKANNMILTIIGDIHPRETLKAIRQYFKNIPEGDSSRDISKPEPPQEELRYKRLEADIQNSYLAIGFPAPPMLHEDSYALEIISHLLGSGRSSRLHQILKSEKEWVNSIETKIENYRDIGFFTISARLNAKHMTEAEISILSEIERLKRTGISDKELEKVKNIIETNVYLDFDTTFKVAQKISHFEQYGDYRFFKTGLERLRSVTPQDIQRVAHHYLTVPRCSIIEYVAPDEKIPSYSQSKLAEKLKTEIAHFAYRLPKPPLPSSPPSLPPSEQGVKKEKIFKVIPKTDIDNSGLKRYQLSNDSIVLLKEMHDLPIVALRVYFKGGRLAEQKKNSGITELLLRTSLHGTTTRTEKEISEGLEHIGAKLEIVCEPDFFGYTLTTLKQHVDEGLKILSDIIFSPSFPIRILNREQQNLLSDMDRLEDQPGEYAYQLFREAALKNHPYGLPMLGLKTAVLKITPDRLIEWHSQVISSADMIISCVGDFNTLEMRTSLENYFKRIKPRRTPFPDIEDIKLPSFISENFKKRNKEQTALLIGFEGVPESHLDTYALKLLAALTSGIGGRFGQRLRDQEKLAYIVNSAYNAYLKGGVFTTYTAVSPENEKMAIRSLLEECKRLKSSLIEKEELMTTKNYLIGLYHIGLESSESQAHEYAKNEVYSKPITATDDFDDKINAITLTDLNDIASRYFDLEKYTLGIIRGIHRAKAIVSTPPKPIITPMPKPKPAPPKPSPEPSPPQPQIDAPPSKETPPRAPESGLEKSNAPAAPIESQ